MSELDRLRARADAWIADDPDPATRAGLRRLVDAGDPDVLRAHLEPPLTFGTAGIRGPLGPGPARMNRAVVRRISAGLAARLASEPRARERGVVVGRDGRHLSAELADDTAGVLAGAGFTVHRFEQLVPTPLVAFAVRHLDAAAGVMVTASHNPPGDNGYKVYWSGGAQIAAPLDTEIAASASAVGRVCDLPLSETGVRAVRGDVVDAYRQACLALLRHPHDRGQRIVYTPLHGVAGSVTVDLLRQAGFADVHVVVEQADPDPRFPTVELPNPEHPGALDLAIGLAGDLDADVVVANDPDGDRIAVAIPDPSARSGWRPLTGDELGCVIAEALLARGEGGPERVVATTVVSSRLLARIAEHHGVRYAETLTGFKWLAPVAARAEAEGGRLVLAYEQALGIMCGDAVRDKDGISAALVFAELAAHRKASGSSVAEALDELALRHGLHLTTGRAVRLEGPDGAARVEQTIDRLRASPPPAVADIPVTAVDDHVTGVRTTADGSEVALHTPRTQLVGLDLADGARLQVRPSGTEPLLKLYAEVVELVSGTDVVAARRTGRQRLERLADAFLGLVCP